MEKKKKTALSMKRTFCVTLLCCDSLSGKDTATTVEVYWPDGRSVARPLEPSEINSVLEIHYPKDEEEVTPTVEMKVLHTIKEIGEYLKHCCVL